MRQILSPLRGAWHARTPEPADVHRASAWHLEDLLDDLGRRGAAPALIAVRRGVLQSLSGAELVSRTWALARELRRQGITAGEPVALIGPNGFEWVIARFALAAAGTVAVAIDDLATDAELRAILVQCRIKHVICDPARADAITSLDGTLSIITFGADLRRQGLLHSDVSDGSNRRGPWLEPIEPAAMLVYTSGTTGTPKAIVLPHSSIAANIEAMADARLVGAGDRVLLPLPLHHVYPFIVGLLTGLTCGATIVFPESTMGPDLLSAIRLASVSVIVGVPRLYGAICSGLTARIAAAGALRQAMFRASIRLSTLLRRTLGINAGRVMFPALRNRFGEHLRLLVSGGARLDPETLDILIGLGFDVRSGYGLAETSAMFTANMPRHTRWGSEGKAVAGSARIAAPDESGTGEIELKGPQLFLCYLDNPAATKAAFTSDGWFRTGDLGYIDRSGFLYVTGRAKDTIVLGGGKKVSPEELERIYGTSPYIREIAVFEHLGALAALVVPSLEGTRTGALHVDTAIRVALASTAQGLPSYQRIAGFAIVREPLPRTRLGKYRRFLLPQIYESAQHPALRPLAAKLSGEDAMLLRHPVAREVYELLRTRYPKKTISLDASPLLDLGIDSLEWISFGLELEDRLKLRLTEADIGGVVTVRDLLTAAATKASAAPTPVPGPSQDWTAPVGPALALLGQLLYVLDQLAMRVLFRLQVRGAGNLPEHGNFLLVANHASYLDPLAFAAALGHRLLQHCYWAGDPALLFARRWQWPLMRAVHCYPVNEREPMHALAVSAAILERGDSIVWFPEGWRTPDGRLQLFLPGVGHLLSRSPVTVVPAYIDGSFDALPRNRSVPRLHRIRVLIGKPISPSEWERIEGPTERRPQTIADRLHEIVEALGSQLRGSAGSS